MFSLLVRLGLDGSQFESGMKRVQSTGASFAKDFKREVGGTLAAMFAVDKVAEYGKAAIDLAGKLTDLSSKLGVSAEFLQEMSYAAELSGASLDDVSGAMEKLTIARTKALSGDAGMVEAFQKLGVSAADLKSMRIEDIFTKIGGAFENGINPQPLLGALREIAGKGATSLVPAMADGLAQAAENARQLGLVMQNDVVAALDDAGDRIAVMNRTLMGGIGALIANVIQPLFRQLEAIGSAIVTFSQMVADPKANTQVNPLKRLQFLGQQTAQSYRASLDEQDQAAANQAADRERRAALRKNLNLGDGTSESTNASGSLMSPIASNGFNLGNSSDPLARIGGLNQFSGQQDRVITQLQEQVRQLSYIAKNTAETNLKL
jgi:hypothetical protein